MDLWKITAKCSNKTIVHNQQKECKMYRKLQINHRQGEFRLFSSLILPANGRLKWYVAELEVSISLLFEWRKHVDNLLKENGNTNRKSLKVSGNHFLQISSYLSLWGLHMTWVQVRVHGSKSRSTLETVMRRHRSMKFYFTPKKFENIQKIKTIIKYFKTMFSFFISKCFKTKYQSPKS